MSCFSIASRSASSTVTNWSLATSQPLTSSSDSTSRSCTGHQRFCLIGVPHSRWSSRNEMSDWRAAGFVAGARPTGMLTRPKLTEPFQVVRICRENPSEGGSISPPRTGVPAARFPQVARARTIANLWRDAVAAAHPDPAYLHEVDGEWVEVTWAEAARAVDELANGLLALGVQKGQAFALLARTSLEWSLFDFALALVGRRRCADLLVELGARHALRPRAFGGGRRPRRGRGSARQGRRLGRPARHLVLGARRAARARTGVRRRAPDGAERTCRFDRRGRALHVHLHVGDDRPAEGLHDPPSQLLRDGAEGATRWTTG